MWIQTLLFNDENQKKICSQIKKNNSDFTALCFKLTFCKFIFQKNKNGHFKNVQNQKMFDKFCKISHYYEIVGRGMQFLIFIKKNNVDKYIIVQGNKNKSII
jgi:hypothetical protein